MELKLATATPINSNSAVLIVPFMELKQTALGTQDVVIISLNRTFYGIETSLRYS